MKFLSLFSGIEAASVAWEPLGWTPVAFAETAPFPSAVLTHRYPGIPNLGDVAKITADRLRGLGHIDIVIGGFPCQDMSVAGKRDGFAGDRSILFFEMTRIVNELRPAYLLWENVPGLLSSRGGRDFYAILCELDRIGYSGAWTSLDAQWFGLAQRRQRVFGLFALGDSGAQRCTEILSLRTRLSGNPAPGREAGKDVAASLTRGADSGGRGGYAGRRREDDVNIVAATLRRREGAGCGRGDGSDNLVAHSLRADGFDASEDGTGRGTPLVPVAFKELSEGHATYQPADVATSLRTTAGGGGQTANLVGQPIPLDMRQASRGATMTNNRAEGSSGGAPGTGIGAEGDPCPSLAGSHTPAVAYGIHADALDRTGEGAGGTPGERAGLGISEELSPCINAKRPNAVAFQERGREGGPSVESQEELAYSLNAPAGGGRRQEMNIVASMAVRRLTPRECERLMGFEDDWTLIPWKGKPAEECPDGVRYQCLGNSIAIPPLRWIGERIQQVDGVSVSGG